MNKTYYKHILKGIKKILFRICLFCFVNKLCEIYIKNRIIVNKMLKISSYLVILTNIHNYDSIDNNKDNDV